MWEVPPSRCEADAAASPYRGGRVAPPAAEHHQVPVSARALRTMEEIVNSFIESFEGKLQDLARRGLKAKQQTYEELDALRRDLMATSTSSREPSRRSSIWRVGRMSVGCSLAPGPNAGTSTM
jgi:hypothetical protein